ncbi:50S ribosomal protein L11 [Candidatus Vidania fulgoroideae]|nr:50S ribosomal protein L11 [Candidatus Vidania fulgoroideae]
MKIIKLIMVPGGAKPNSRLGSSLGPNGINVPKFCLEFNNLTKKYDKDIEITVNIVIDKIGKYKILLKGPTTYSLLKKYLNFKKGGLESVKGIVLKEDIIKKIVSKKKKDFNTLRYCSNRKTIISCAKSLGIKIKNV